ncbi:NAD-dependent epimerase/dehydratase family protein [uncultured Paludibaculum sp.]|uniref:NAD-dependent epimerase/dehydratase family protein n=1 Tax=uncultured Paludibaculum sp. TaxID=1765020 RepID=UPI002AAAD3C3|nr:NAD-dependent epimerase/dehydratase family protein [uncultured Paludibaculum sp.]
MNKSFWAGRPTLVTGATGLMGGWLTRRLVDAGAEVVALVRDSVPNSLAVQDGLLRRVTCVHGRLEDFDLLRRAFSEYSIDTVFHLAAQPLVGVAKVDPLGTLETNVRGSWNLLEAARLCGTRQVIVASSDKAYGDSETLPYLETHALQGRYPYDVSKSCTDLIARMYACTYQLPVVVARCANLFGGGDLNFSRVVPGAIRSTLHDQPFLIRSDGKFVRDFIYLEDATDAYVTLAEALGENRSLAGEAFNFGLGLQLTVLDVVHEILRVMDRPDLKPVIQNQASNEIRMQYLCSDKAREWLGWKPRYSMEEGLRETAAWYGAYFRRLADCEPAVEAAKS